MFPGGDLAVDAPRDRARALLEKLDEHFNSNLVLALALV